MRFETSKANIVEAANSVATVVPRSPSISLLGNILIEALESTIKLTGSDMETWVCVSVPAQVSEQGETTVPSRIFTELVSNLPGEDFSISIGENGQMVITSGKARVTLNCANPEDYPRIPKISNGEEIKLERDTLISIVDKVTPSLSERMEDKRELLGALVSCTGGKFNLVGTDGQRLAICEVPVQSQAQIEAIVAGTVWRNLTKLIGDGENADVDITFTQTQVGFTFGKVAVVSRLIEGDYPPYRQVIPPRFEHKVIVDHKELMSALARVNIIVRQSSRKVSLVIKEGEVLCKGIAPEIGEVEERLEASTDGADMELSFDIKKLMDGIKGATGPAVQINANGPLHTVLVQTEGDDSYRYILVTQR